MLKTILLFVVLLSIYGCGQVAYKDVGRDISSIDQEEERKKSEPLWRIHGDRAWDKI